MNRKEIEERLTALVCNQLENGIVPWRKPWQTAGILPTSLQTGKTYRGMNLFMLSLLGGQYDRSLWVTFRQAKYLGGHVKRGETGLPIVYYSMINKVNKDTGETYRVPLLRLTNVFNIAQTEGIVLPKKFTETREPVAVLDGVKTIQAKYTEVPITNDGGDRAYYSPMTDSIHLPSLKAFNTAEEYASTFAHEVIHSTGHKNRLDRFTAGETFGCKGYAKEELVAEIGNQMLLAEVGVSMDTAFLNSASYLTNWLGALNKDTSLLMKAARDAQKAVDYVLGIKTNDTEEAEAIEAEGVML